MTKLWDVRTQMEIREAEKLDEIINTNIRKRSYYILKASKWTDPSMTVLKTAYLLYSKKPPKVLGTVLWLVDNTKGTISKIWELPQDRIVSGEFLDSKPQEHIAESAKDIAPAIIFS